MSTTAKNIFIALAVLTAVFAGFYMYLQYKSGDSSMGQNELIEAMVARTQVFIERRTILDSIDLQTEIFTDPVFTSYRSFSEPVIPESFGRENPFVVGPPARAQ